MLFHSGLLASDKSQTASHTHTLHTSVQNASVSVSWTCSRKISVKLFIWYFFFHSLRCCVPWLEPFVTPPDTRWSPSSRGRTTTCRRTRRRWSGSCRAAGSTTMWPTARPRSSSVRRARSSAWRSSGWKWSRGSSSSSRRWESDLVGNPAFGGRALNLKQWDTFWIKKFIEIHPHE